MIDYEYLRTEAEKEGINDFALGAAIYANASFLIVERASDERHFPNYFEFPGGRLEKGESLIDALIREMHEETGLKIAKIIRYLDTFDFPTDEGVTVRQFNFLVLPIDVNIILNPKEHSSYKWIKQYDELDNLLITPNMRDSVLFALEHVSA